MAQPLRQPKRPKVDATALFQQHLSRAATDTETLLDSLLAPAPAADEIARRQRLLDAMRYSSLGGGRRFRPFLVTETAALFEVPRGQALMAAAALECVRCYSLIHDDLSGHGQRRATPRAADRPCGIRQSDRDPCRRQPPHLRIRHPVAAADASPRKQTFDEWSAAVVASGDKWNYPCI